MGGTAVVTQGIYVPLLFLPLTLSDLILGTAFYSLEEGGANQHNVVPHPIVWDFGCTVRAHHFAHNMQEIQVAESSTAKGLSNLIPEGLHCWCYVVPVSFIVAVGYILQCVGILQDHMLLGAQLLVAVMVNLMVEGLYHMGCWWADIGALSGPLVCLNQAPQADHFCGYLLVVHGTGTP